MAYRNGEVKLSDFVGVKESEKWGTTRHTLSLKNAQEVAKKGSIVSERTVSYKIAQSFTPMLGATDVEISI